MTRKTKAELELEIKWLERELFYKNEYIETLEYLHKHDKAKLRAICGARDIELQKYLELHDALVPLHFEKQAQKKRAVDINTKKAEHWKGYLETYKSLIEQDKTQKEARDFIQKLIHNETKKKPPRSTIRNIFK